MHSIHFPKRLSLAQLPTPLQPLNRLHQYLTEDRQLAAPRIWLKRDDLTGSLLSGNKVRKLEFCLAQALDDGCDTIITCGGLQSNHCRATAILSAQLGLRCHLLLRGEPDRKPDGNLLLDHLAGAIVNAYPKAQYQAELNQLLLEWQGHHANHGNKAFIIPTGASDEIGVWGYVAACQELKQDFQSAGIQPQHIICATGSAGTQAGLTAGSHLYELGAQVHGMAVCDDEQWFLDKINADLQAWQTRYQVDIDLEAINASVIDDYIGPGYAIADQEVFDCIKLLGRTEGIIFDPVYTGKAFYGMLQEIEKGRFENATDIVFVHTGGLFGLFPQRENLF